MSKNILKKSTNYSVGYTAGKLTHGIYESAIYMQVELTSTIAIIKLQNITTRTLTNQTSKLVQILIEFSMTSFKSIISFLSLTICGLTSEEAIE